MFIPSLSTLKLTIIAAALIASFAGGVTVTRWYYKAGEVQAFKEQVARFRDQATQDRTKLAERDKELARIDNEAAKWRQRYRDALRADPIVKAWADTPHPPAVGLMLGGTLDLSSDSNP